MKITLRLLPVLLLAACVPLTPTASSIPAVRSPTPYSLEVDRLRAQATVDRIATGQAEFAYVERDIATTRLAIAARAAVATADRRSTADALAARETEIVLAEHWLEITRQVEEAQMESDRLTAVAASAQTAEALTAANQTAEAAPVVTAEALQLQLDTARTVDAATAEARLETTKAAGRELFWVLLPWVGLGALVALIVRLWQLSRLQIIRRFDGPGGSLLLLPDGSIETLPLLTEPAEIIGSEPEQSGNGRRAEIIYNVHGRERARWARAASPETVQREQQRARNRADVLALLRDSLRYQAAHPDWPDNRIPGWREFADAGYGITGGEEWRRVTDLTPYLRKQSGRGTLVSGPGIDTVHALYDYIGCEFNRPAVVGDVAGHSEQMEQGTEQNGWNGGTDRNGKEAL